MEFSEVNCSVCERNEYKIIYPDTLGKKVPVFGYKWTPEIRKMYRLVQCKNCTHAYTSPRLMDMYKYYEDVKDDGYLENSSLRRQTARNVISTILKYVREGNLLDVGCSTGDFLEVAKKFYKVDGLELSDWAVKIAREKGFNVFKETLEERVKIGEKLYDIITLWGVIEHLESPKREMEFVNNLLRPDGIVCFWTGDFNSIYAKIFRQKWLYILGQHIQFFSWKSMDYLMKECGFERIYKGRYPYVISFKYLATSLSRYPVIGNLSRICFKLLGIEGKIFTIRKSDEMFAIYKKIKSI